MARKERATGCQSTPNQQNRSFEGSHQSVKVHPQQSKPIAIGESNSLEDAHPHDLNCLFYLYIYLH